MIDCRSIRIFRKERSLTLRQLADEVGIHYAYLSQIERGKAAPSQVLLQRLTSVLRIDSEQFSLLKKKPQIPESRRFKITSRLSSTERSIRDLLARKYYEDVRSGLDFTNSGWVRVDYIKQNLEGMDPESLANRMLFLKVIEKKNNRESFVRLNYKHKENQKLLEEAKGLSEYWKGFNRDLNLKDKVIDELDLLTNQLSGSENRRFSRILIPGFAKMLIEAQMKVEPELLEAIGIDYQDFYIKKRFFLPWAAAHFTSRYLSKYCWSKKASNLLLDARDFYLRIGLRSIIELLDVKQQHSIIGLHFVEGFRLSHLGQIDPKALEALAFCWLAQMYLEGRKLQAWTLEGERKGFSGPIMEAALQSASVTFKNHSEFISALINPLENLWEETISSIETNQEDIAALGRLLEIVQFPWEV